MSVSDLGFRLDRVRATLLSRRTQIDRYLAMTVAGSATDIRGRPQFAVGGSERQLYEAELAFVANLLEITGMD